MKPSPLHDKLKRASIHRLILELDGQPELRDFYRLGKALEWRYKLVDRLLSTVRRGQMTEQDLLNYLPGLVVIRQIEDELSEYQEEITGLADELAAGEIDEDEFERRLEALTIAILILAFLGGRGGDENEELKLLAIQTLESGGTVRPDFDLSGLPEEAATQLQAEIEIAQDAGAGLADDITAGRYEENEAELLSRLAMWAVTAAGVYALGQLFKRGDDHLRWNRSPLKDSCVDCLRLDNQVHTSKAWQASGWRPQSRSLNCEGYRCGCYFTRDEGPSRGNF